MKTEPPNENEEVLSLPCGPSIKPFGVYMHFNPDGNNGANIASVSLTFTDKFSNVNSNEEKKAVVYRVKTPNLLQGAEQIRDGIICKILGELSKQDTCGMYVTEVPLEIVHWMLAQQKAGTDGPLLTDGSLNLFLSGEDQSVVTARYDRVSFKGWCINYYQKCVDCVDIPAGTPVFWT